jgi:hypothetical protein
VEPLHSADSDAPYRSYSTANSYVADDSEDIKGETPQVVEIFHSTFFKSYEAENQACSEGSIRERALCRYTII